jgi:hypothetical protein
MINIKKLFTKAERGTHKGRVKVTREGKTFTQIRALGKKDSPRAGTGKLAKFPESIKKEILEQRSYGESGAKIKSIVENLVDTMSEKDQSQMKSLGLIDDKRKLTVTAQALTSWAKSQGIESTKKRTSAVDAEKVKHESTKKDLEQADKKIVRLEVTAKHNLEEIKLVQQSKQESDKIRQNLGKENKTLSEKLKACLRGK